MHALVKNNQIVKYPYSVAQLKKDYPNISFPKTMTDEALAEYGVLRVFFSSRPEVSYMQELRELTPVIKDNRWTQVWQAVELSEEELSRRTEQKSTEVRSERDVRLAESDWTQIQDAPVNKAEWAVYRQALRDVPEQEGFPWAVIWPGRPA